MSVYLVGCASNHYVADPHCVTCLGLCCRIEHFAELFSKKLGMSATALRKTLWGDFYLETKKKLIRKGALVRAIIILLSRFVCENAKEVSFAATSICIFCFRQKGRSRCLFSLFWKTCGQCTKL